MTLRSHSKKRQALYRNVALATLVVTMACIAALTVTAVRWNNLHAATLAFSQQILQFERAIGYDGFSQHFAELSQDPFNDALLETTTSSYTRVREALDEVQTQATGFGLDTDLSEFSAILDQYGANLTFIRLAKQRDLTHAQVIATIRVPDIAGSTSLQQFDASFAHHVDAQRSALMWQTAAFIVVGAATGALFLLFGGLWIAATQGHREASNRLQLVENITQNLPFTITLVDQDNRIQYVTQGLQNSHVGKAPSGEVGKPLAETLRALLIEGRYILPGLSLEEALEQLLSDEPLEFETRSGRILERTVVPLETKEKLIIRRDITPERQLRDRLEAGQRQLELVINAAQNAIFLIGSGGLVHYTNPKARTLLGMATPVDKFLWPNDIIFTDTSAMERLDAENHPIFQILNGGKPTPHTLLWEHPPTQTRAYVRISTAETVTDTDGKTRHLIMLEDVTELEHVRQQRERETRLEALGHLTGGITHEFRNLLATIELSTELIEDDIASEETAELLPPIRRAVERGLTLTSQLSTFAYQQPAEAQVANITKVMGSAVRRAEQDSDGVHIMIEWQAVEPDLLAACDPTHLETGLYDLILNAQQAIRASGTGDRIVLNASPRKALHESVPQNTRALIKTALHTPQFAPKPTPSEWIVITVADNGPGMSSEILQRATDPFFTTGDPTTSKGLGLSMIFGFARHAGGTLNILSEQQTGTAVQIILPRQNGL